MTSKRKRLPPAKFRRQYQRDFMNWFAENWHLFAIAPLKPRVTVHYIDFRFPNVSPVFSIRVMANAIVVDVTWKQKWFDRILDMDMYPVWNGSSYRCELCDETQELYLDLTTMRSAHLYIPFLLWCNEDFLTSRWLEMAMTKCWGGCSARLLREIDDPEGRAILGIFSRLKRIDGQPTPGAKKAYVFHLPTFVADDKCTSCASNGCAAMKLTTNNLRK